MKTYAGIDLHSSNNFIGIIDAKDNRLYSKRHHNLMPDILKVLGKFKSTLQGVVVESTYNWCWLVDGLMDHGYRVHLAKLSAIKTYEGLKHTDDKWDPFWLAHLLRLGILPQGYIYPKAQRSIRDLLRRRQLYVRQRTSHIEKLLSIPGIGDILGLTIMAEVGDINRFAKAGHHRSYCRCVSSKRISNGKKKGENNKKNGNRYLSWAYVEAANFCIRNCPEAHRFYQRKLARTKKVVAIKALSNKLAKASYHIIKDQVPFDAKKLFG